MGSGGDANLGAEPGAGDLPQRAGGAGGHHPDDDVQHDDGKEQEPDGDHNFPNLQRAEHHVGGILFGRGISGGTLKNDRRDVFFVVK